jgi:uncharacterized phage infection (PIP) family protein YhgE
LQEQRIRKESGNFSKDMMSFNNVMVKIITIEYRSLERLP